MKHNIYICLITLLAVGCSLSVIAQDSILTEPPQIIKEVIIRETKWKTVRDTVILQPDSAISASLQILNAKMVGIGAQQELNSKQLKLYEEKSEGLMRVLKWLIGIGIVLILAVLMCLIYLVVHTAKFNKGHEVKNTQGITPKDSEEKKPEQTTPLVPFPTKPTRPSLEAYNASVYEFTILNDQVANLKRKDTKPIVLAMYRFLSLQSADKAALLSQIRSANISEDVMEQFVALVSRIDAFLIQKKPIIDAWLYWEPKDGVDNYEKAIRMPEGLTFDESLDEDVLGDNIEGRQISMVHKMGFYFPGNTIKPYREKSVVSA